MFVSLLYSPLRAVRVILAINAHTHTHLCIRITRDRSSHVFACGLKCVCAHACLQALSPNCSSPMHTPGSGTQKNLTSGICQLSHTLEALSKTRQPAKEPHEWDLPIESHTRGPWMARRKKTRTSILKLKPGWLEEKKTRRLIPHARTLPHPHCTISAPNGIKGSVDSTIPRGRLPPPDCTKTPTICIPEISSHQGRGPSR